MQNIGNGKCAAMAPVRALQLNELADRNAECVEMLHESQEEIKELRSKNAPSAGLRRHLSYGLYPMVRETLSGPMLRHSITSQRFMFKGYVLITAVR